MSYYNKERKPVRIFAIRTQLKSDEGSMSVHYSFDNALYMEPVLRKG